MANRPLTAWLLSIVIAMGVCLPAPALASDMPQGGAAAQDRASVQESSSSESGLSVDAARDGRLLAGTASGVGLPADDDDPSLPDGASSGACGEDATWAFDASTRTLTISGTGSVSDN